MGEHQMVLISFRDYNQLKKNSENFLLQKSRANLNDNKKGHGAMEIEEAIQLPNTEIPKQDLYQEKYAKAVLNDSSDCNDSTLVSTSAETATGGVKISSKNTKDISDKWYYIGIPKCMEKN